MKRVLFTSLLLLLLSLGCDRNGRKSDYTIKSGSSFGFCIGDCYKEISVNNVEAVLWVAEQGRTGLDDPEIKNKRAISDEEWNQILRLVNKDTLMALPEVIGCPDCADGGAEWIELQTSETSKKVTFEYGNSPPGTEELMSKLREIRNQLYEAIDTTTAD